MSLAIVYSRAATGIAAPLVTVEIHLSKGLAGLNIVGLPAAAVKESKDRVRSALMNTHFDFPIRRIIINLAPADLPKEGGRFDLPIALGILAASDQIPKAILEEYEFLGELALTGELRGVRGVLPVILSARQTGRKLIVPYENREEAAIINSENVFVAKDLVEVCAHLQGMKTLPLCNLDAVALKTPLQMLDIADVKGQPHAKRALEIAAAGRHSLLYVGPPGTGKTMLASRLPTILPDINDHEALEIAAIASVSSNGFDVSQWKSIPFRSPHHTSSSVALVGGGRPPKPGEISLAHHGVLFLDELPEFGRHTLECLREPLEAGQVTISRATFQTIFPARFQFIAAMNPCPCGYAGSNDENGCQCSTEQIKRYLSKISGPLLNRIDMHVEVGRVLPEVLANTKQITEESSVSIRERVVAARFCQNQRQRKCNTVLSPKELEIFCPLQPSAQQFLNQAMAQFKLSARVYHRIIKLARTIADLEECEIIAEKHVSEALNYRCLDRLQLV